MLIVAIAWIYVVLMMAVTTGMEKSIFAGIMTFSIYCVLPLSLIFYVRGSPNRKKRRDAEFQAAHQARLQQEQSALSETVITISDNALSK